MGNKDSVMSGYGQESWYSDWMWPDMMVHWLDFGRKNGVLTGLGQEKWCTDQSSTGEMVY